MASKSPFKLSSSPPGPGDHNITGPVAKALLTHPRDGHWAIVQIRSGRTSTEHPPDEPDEQTPLVVLDSLYVVMGEEDRARLEEMEARARLDAGGQATLDQALGDGPGR